MSEVALGDYNRDVLRAFLTKPSRAYWIAVGGLLMVIVWGACCWAYQISSGMGVAGIDTPGRVGHLHRELRVLDRDRSRRHADLGHPLSVPGAMAAQPSTAAPKR